MGEGLREQCTDCDYIYDSSEHHDVTLVERVDWECPGTGKTLCGASADKYEILEPISPLDEPEEESEEEDHADALYPSTLQREINAERADKAVTDLVRQVDEGELLLRPDWQRYYVWKAKQASQLVESLFLKLPIPLIYLAEEDDGTFSVVDGQQRLTALYEFVSNKRVDKFNTSDVRLTGMEVIAELNGKRFADLPVKTQKFLRNRELQIIRIKSDSDPELKLKVFRRLNTGSVKLNAQELRNAAYQGQYNLQLRKWASNPTFLKMLRADAKPDIRMLDVELILRCCAWINRGWPALKSKNIAMFLDQEMRLGASYNMKELSQLEKKIKSAVELSWQAFGERAFRRYFAGAEDETPDGEWETRQVNKALFDVVMYGFTTKTKNQFWPHLESIREALVDLMARDTKFQDSITSGTTDPKRVDYRFKVWTDTLDEIVKDDPQSRTFTKAFKVELFEAQNKCFLCKQEIHDIDDAHVHHIEHYWRGGKTIPENAALTHRYCNLSEGGGKAS